jgi:rRNA processing protein Gar1
MYKLETGDKFYIVIIYTNLQRAQLIAIQVYNNQRKKERKKRKKEKKERKKRLGLLLKLKS